jgi:hypothetical protein
MGSVSRFKYRISALLPLHPYTQSASPTPTHPFLTLSILPFTPSISPSTPILNHLIDRALIHASCGASSVQAVESLLILSFAPLPKPEPGSLARCHLSSAELIALAYNMGQGIGLEMRSQASLKDSSYWEESWYITRVQETLMVGSVMVHADVAVGSRQIEICNVCSVFPSSHLSDACRSNDTLISPKASHPTHQIITINFPFILIKPSSKDPYLAHVQHY